jgi:putative restriction endonuclease
LQGAHIWAVSAGGPHEVRNGISLCVRHHWAFDHGFFTLSRTHTLEWLAPSPDPHAEAQDGVQLLVPSGEHAPHATYVNWHRTNWGALASD